MGWKREKKSRIGVRTSFVRYLMNMYRVSESKVIFVYLLAPPHMALGALTSSSAADSFASVLQENVIQ